MQNEKSLFEFLYHSGTTKLKIFDFLILTFDF